MSMSEPVSNAEIEDVLSSIRRLVSVDHRGEAGLGVKVDPKEQASHEDDQDIENDDDLSPAEDITDVPDVAVYGEPETGAVADDRPDQESKLVLTQALRVLEDEQDADWQDLETGVTDASAQDDDLAEDAADELQSDDVPEHDDNAKLDTDVGSETTTVTEFDYDAPFDDLDEATSLDEGDDPLKAPEDGSEFVRLRSEPGIGNVMADALATKEPDDVWPEVDLQDDPKHMSEGQGTNAPMDVVPEADIWEVDENAQSDEQAQADAQSTADPEDVPADTSTSLETELESRIAEVEAAVAARQDQWEPDADEQDDYAGGAVEPLKWEDHAASDNATEDPVLVDEKSPEEVEAIEEAIVLEEAAQAITDSLGYLHQKEQAADELVASDKDPVSEPRFVVPPVVPSQTSDASDASDETAGWYADDTILDEEALRDLVSEIVRQELQGALGERITRNVRKLVRREIHRAMMGQDYD